MNATSYPYLYRSLKGGSNKFGVITRFDMKTFEQGPFWGGIEVYPVETRHQHFAALERFTAADPFDKYAAFVEDLLFTRETGWIILNFYQYTKQPPEAFPPTFQPFTTIQPQFNSTLRVAPLSGFTLELGAGSPSGDR